MKIGSRPTTRIEVLKVKNGRSTVIEEFGKRYVLDMRTPEVREKKMADKLILQDVTVDDKEILRKYIDSALLLDLNFEVTIKRKGECNIVIYHED